MHCDALLDLDELSQVGAKEAGEIVYMLFNGAGKNRSRRDGAARRTPHWRLMLLSSGEVSLADKMAEIGRQARAGQEVRLVEVAADAGKGLGLFEELHGSASARALTEELRKAALRYYGSPSRLLLELLRDLPKRLRQLAERRSDFIAAHLPAEASGQVGRVCKRFALVAAAGELASEFGITAWPAGDAERGVARCFDDWLKERGGAGDSEGHAGIRQVRAFIENHGRSRFEPVWSGHDPNERDERMDERQRTPNRVGFRRLSAGGWEYFVMTEAWRAELAKGHDPAALAEEMIQRGLMVRDAQGKSSVSKRIPGHGSMRVYHVLPSILSGGESGN
jgi:putative DNA primase/helicase